MSREIETEISAQAEIHRLSKDEEIQLAKLMESGRAARIKFTENPEISDSEKLVLTPQIEAGFKARATLIESNLPLVISIGKRYLGKGKAFDDLKQVGSIGLIRAVDKFDYKRGHRLSTLAVWWITDAITASFRRSKEKDKDGYFPLSLDEPLKNENGKEISLGEIIPGGTPPVQETVEINIQRQAIADAFEKVLSPRQKEAVSSHYIGAIPLVEVGEEMGIHWTNAQRLEKRAFDAVRRSSFAPVLRAYLD